MGALKWIMLTILIVGSIGQIAAQEAGLSDTTESIQRSASYEQLFDEFMSLSQRTPQGVAVVNDFTIQRDVSRFDMSQGKLYLLAPILNRPAAAIFKGNGVFSFSPPTRIEQEQLYRFYERKLLEDEFNFLFLIFADSTYKEFQKNLTFQREESSHIEAEVENALKYLSEEEDQYFDTNIMKTFLDNEENGLFYAHISQKKSKPLFFEIDPYEIEEVLLMHRAETSRFYNIPEVICQFHKKEDYELKTDLINEEKNHVKVKHYDIETTIKGNLGLDFSAITELEFESLKPNQHWIHFELFYDLKIDSAFWQNGERAIFFKGKENPVLWIQCDPHLEENVLYGLKLYYHGELLTRDLKARIYIRSTTNWYPTYGIRMPATFDLIYHTPKKFPVFASVGEKVSESQDTDYITSHWVVRQPINFASFNLADYETFEPKDDRVPPVKVMAYKGSRALKDVGSDVVNSMALFEEIFGDYPVDNFYATETPYRHGLAFPGLIHLSSTTFRETGNKGYDEIFRAHEVAHQWWGIEVDYATYHDKWLSEGLCDFAGLKYMQTLLFQKNGTKKYFDVLNKWRKQILTNRKYLFGIGSGQEAGPICLGYRTSSSRTEGDYDLIIYKKGAWVFHMLRMMLINVKNLGNETRFTNMMRDFYDTYRGKKVCTRDFQKIVEKHAGMDMDWFFRQWIDEVDIPKYTFSYETEQTKDGRFLIRAKVKQENVSDNFRMPILFNIDFGDKGTFTTRKFVEGSESDIILLKAPFKPSKVIFNYLESVLCD